uniref:Carboxylic ester hydrolase n=1 Tax=Culicoides sonorensis TaxID=179676 RepID=A0A336LYR5_CULSO
MLKQLIFIFLQIISLGKGLLVEELEVETQFGKIKGFVKDHFTGFEGIPYAEPPLGNLRFESPVPLRRKWGTVLNASKPGNTCLQWTHLALDNDDKLVGDEDCLYLNIYTPKNISKLEKLPVIFHIHGGALMYGSGDFYGPEYITTRPLIMVNFNYRVGPLGFISTGCDLIPGNMGMKDQVAALKWVKENIEVFGGDSKKITITGFSAGGASVHLHTMSNLSSGLFNNAISHSGTAFDPWVMQRNPKNKFSKVAELVGCGSVEGHKEKVACLKEKPAQQIVKTVKDFQTWLYNPFQVFGVVIEPQLENVDLEDSHHLHTESFLSDTPENLIKNSTLNGNAWLVSESKDEGLYPCAEFLRKPHYLSYIDQNWNNLAPALLMFNETITQEELSQVSQIIREHYLGDKSINEENFKRFVDIFTDRFFHFGLDRAVKLQGKKMPTYVYYYSYKLSLGVGEIFSGKTSDLLGVAHGDDVLLLYYIQLANTELTENETLMQSKLLDMYVDFSNDRIPKFGQTELPTTDDETAVKYLAINDPGSTQINSYDNIGNNKFWRTINFNEN